MTITNNMQNEIDPHEDLQKLAMTDKQYAKARARVSALEYQIKIAESLGYLRADGTQEERKSEARASQAYGARVRELDEATLEMLTLGAERRTCELRIEVWRSENANRRQGNV